MVFNTSDMGPTQGQCVIENQFFGTQITEFCSENASINFLHAQTHFSR